MSEPTTVLTDYVLAMVAAVLAARLRGGRAAVPAHLWAWSFAALAVAAVLGGTWHGIPATVLPALRHFLWSLTYVFIGLADALLLAGAARAALTGTLRAAAFLLLGVRLLVYAVGVVSQRSFGWVAVEFGGTVLVLVAFGLHLAWRQHAAARFVLAGAAASFLGGLVLALHFSLHSRFNQNDLFHVIQAGGLCLLFKGAAALGHYAPAAIVPAADAGV